MIRKNHGETRHRKGNVQYVPFTLSVKEKIHISRTLILSSVAAAHVKILKQKQFVRFRHAERILAADFIPTSDDVLRMRQVQTESRSRIIIPLTKLALLFLESFGLGNRIRIILHTLGEHNKLKTTAYILTETVFHQSWNFTASPVTI